MSEPTDMVSATELLELAEAAKDELVACSITLSGASKWASRDHSPLSPLAIIAMPLKYFKLGKARKQLAAAKQRVAQLEQRYKAAHGLTQADIEISGLAVLFDVWAPVDAFGLFNTFAEMHIADQIETALLSVNGLLDDVGLMCTRLRTVRDRMREAPAP